MWYYFVSHVIYHFTRWFPKNERTGVRMFVIFISLLFVIPQIIILMDDASGRFCSQPLLNLMVTSIGMTFAMIAFSFLFAMMEPVPWKLKIAFHFFGFFSLIVGMIQFGVTLDSSNCDYTTPRLYVLSLSFGIFAFVTGLFICLCVPFWFVNYFWPDSVLNRKERRGICYEPVKCCSCIWHV